MSKTIEINEQKILKCENKVSEIKRKLEVINDILLEFTGNRFNERWQQAIELNSTDDTDFKWKSRKEFFIYSNRNQLQIKRSNLQEEKILLLKEKLILLEIILSDKRKGCYSILLLLLV